MKILVPLKVPFFPDVAKVGIKLAKAMGAELSFLNVADTRPMRGYVKFPERVVEGLKEDGREVLADATKLADKEGVKVETIIWEGDPAEEIIREAEEGGYNLVILGSHKGDLDSFSVGTVTYQVAEYVKLPVIVVKRDVEIQKILVCTDGSESAEEAEYCGGYLAKKLGAEVTILSVAYGTVEPTYTGTAAISEDLKREFMKEAKKAAEKAADIIKGFSLKADTKVKVGSASEEIIKESKKYDLVVLGSRGLSKLKRLVIGHVSLRVLENADTNVLIVRNCALYRDWKKGH